MLDDFRKQADETDFESFEVDKEKFDLSETPSDGRIFGLTAGQRLIIAVMLLAITLLLGTLWLMVTGKIVPSFLY